MRGSPRPKHTNKKWRQNNYYPFGLQHQGYNDIANSCRNEEAEAYKLNGKEYEDSFGLNIYEMDLRQLDPAIGRWTVMDPVTHHDYSPYSAFDNNPVYWSDPSGADSHRQLTHVLSAQGDQAVNLLFGIIVTAGEINDGQDLIAQLEGFDSFEEWVNNIGKTPDNAADENGDGSSDGNGGPGKESKRPSDSKALTLTEFMYSVNGAYGSSIWKIGEYNQTNGKKGSFKDRSYKRLSKNAKSNYDFAKNLKFLKKAGTTALVVSGTIDLSNGIIKDYKNYETTGQTNGRHTVTATVKVGTGVAVGWLAGAGSGAAIGTLIPIPGVGTVAGAIVGGYLGYKASEAAGSYMDSVYE